MIMKTSTRNASTLDSDLYGGLDLHSDNVFCALLDAARNVVFEKRPPNDIDAIRLALEPYKACFFILRDGAGFDAVRLTKGS